MTTYEKTTDDRVNISTTPAGAHANQSLPSKVGHFLWNFIEMMLSMSIGMGIFHLLIVRIPSSSSYAVLFQPKTVLYSIWMNLAMVISMVAWMIIRKHGWRHSLEMAAASIGPSAVIWAICWLGGDSYTHKLLSTTDLLMSLGMLTYMVYRRDHFTGRAHHSEHADHYAGEPSCHEG